MNFTKTSIFLAVLTLALLFAHEAAACSGSACSADTSWESFERMFTYGGFIWIIVAWVVKTGPYRGIKNYWETTKLLIAHCFVGILFFVVAAIVPEGYGLEVYGPIGGGWAHVDEWIPVAVTAGMILGSLLLVCAFDWFLLRKSISKEHARFMKVAIILGNLFYVSALPVFVLGFRVRAY